MTTISVKFASISQVEYQQIIDYYNSIKPNHYMMLKNLDRCEGGFQIALDDSELALVKSCDVNCKIKQLRWKNRKLDPMNHKGFTQEETLRLYQSLVHVFGQSLVSYDDPTH